MQSEEVQQKLLIILASTTEIKTLLQKLLSSGSFASVMSGLQDVKKIKMLIHNYDIDLKR